MNDDGLVLKANASYTGMDKHLTFIADYLSLVDLAYRLMKMESEFEILEVSNRNVVFDDFFFFNF